MSLPSSLDKYMETDKQRGFSRDFIVGWKTTKGGSKRLSPFTAEVARLTNELREALPHQTARRVDACCLRPTGDVSA